MKKFIAFLVSCFVFLACLAPVAMAEEEADEQDVYWTASGRETLWNALNVEGGEPLTEEETDSFLAEYAADYEMYGADEDCFGSFRIGADRTVHAELFAWEDRTVGSGKIVGIIRLSDWVYALEIDGMEWEEDDLPELVQNQMLFQVPGVSGDSGAYLVYETQNVAEMLGLDPARPTDFCLVTGFDSTPLWYRGGIQE